MTSGEDQTAETVLFSKEIIAARVSALAREIATAPVRPEIAAPVLVGAFVFAADLMRALSAHGLDLATEMLWLRAYGVGFTPGAVNVLHAPSDAVRGKNILLIDGVLDSGVTVARAKSLLMEKGAAHVALAVAVTKRNAARNFEADYSAFQASEEFLYGYGMDYSGAARGLPDIRVK